MCNKNTIQYIFAEYIDDFLKEYSASQQQLKVINNIITCRTPEQGYHVSFCSECGYEHISYNSCRDRHCPICQTFKKEEWINDRKAEVLNTKYFHIVFTLPKELSLIAMHNQKLIYSLLFKASSQTIKELMDDDKYLGASVGFTSIFHTWGQNLDFHPHVHMIVTGGGLKSNRFWKKGNDKFFIPVRVLSKKFRGKFLALFAEFFNEGKINFFDSTAHLKNTKDFYSMVNNLYRKNWYTYVKRPFNGPEAVIEYFGRYSHRIAISNSRIVKVENGKVFFKYKDYKDNSKIKIMSLNAVEFIRRFLLHVLPKGFRKIRHYGILANVNKKTKLLLARRLTGILGNSFYQRLSKLEILLKITNNRAFLCPKCGKNTLMPPSWSFYNSA